jgi:hypothetical protein
MEILWGVLIVGAIVGGAWLGLRVLFPSKPMEPTRAAPTITLHRRGQAPVMKVIEPSEGSFDDWLAEMDAKSKALRSGQSAPKITVAELDPALPLADLRTVESSRFRIVGTAAYLTDDERAVFGGTEYVLVHETDNEHDANAVAVYGRGRKVGYLSAAKAAGIAPQLDRLGAGGYTVGGAGTSEASIRLWVDIPKAAALRAHSL